ncbi:MAG: glycogen synthase GlgA [Candidatus Brocadiia bacterium]
MKIVIVASEVVPYSKTGGLGDVIGSLPVALDALGEDVAVISPLYRQVRQNAEKYGLQLEEKSDSTARVPVGDLSQPAGVVLGRLPDSGVTVYFLENDQYYDRDGLYVNPRDGNDYQDNSERFVFLSRGALEIIEELELEPDVIHTHDWQTGLLPIYVEHLYQNLVPNTATVFTIHNLAYQGLFWHWDMKLTGLPWELFNWQMLEYYGNLSFLKAGLVGADVITTVSRHYANEIQTEEFGMGMEGVLRDRSENLFGIVNGINTSVWDPETDDMIPANYTADDLTGKSRCKETLQVEYDLPQDSDIPLIGMIGRLVEQKGIDILLEGIPDLMDQELQLVILGTGKEKYHRELTEFVGKYPQQLGIRLDFDEELAHHSEAGSDMFLMPSEFEPCGLNQLYSMIYGTIPIVSATGGLVDTVTDYNEQTVRQESATGFMFKPKDSQSMVSAVSRACDVYKNKPESWQNLMERCMAQDWSWERSAREYVDVYKKALGCNQD